ncbi:DUF1177 domain-containing protein [Oscillibacter sp. MSJ-2]|uniref:DUF1177 domain-containing protein n=1 Tax=Dysosmobacter acutus TaxID=2841504 RepID=A0ABS6FC78_9FIRM|nr:DUF1177 domain-containing protein [Dysosmobacter acutus]MBU5627172.1 DUF1177 domain-containing protein [Dysosmobacter acutus]
MLIKQVIEVFDLLDSARASGESVQSYLQSKGAADITVKRIQGGAHSTDFIKIVVPGKNGKTAGGSAPTFGVVGRLGAIGARPEVTGYVSDGDGALCALSVASKLIDMKAKGDELEGDVILCTQICPNAPTQPHEPVPFMGSPVDMATMNREEVDGAMEAILSIDTTKGNNVINVNGFAISQTVKEGYILRYSSDVLDVMQRTTGKAPHTFGVSVQDITPYGNDLYHLNSILQPSIATNAPVIGVALTTELPVAGCATGASHFVDVEETARFVLEVAKAFCDGKCRFYDEAEFQSIVKKYGKMNHLQTMGVGAE